MKSEYDANVALSANKWPSRMPAVKFKKPNYFFLIAINIFVLIMCLPIFVMLIKGVI